MSVAENKFDDGVSHSIKEAGKGSNHSGIGMLVILHSETPILGICTLFILTAITDWSFEIYKVI